MSTAVIATLLALGFFDPPTNELGYTREDKPSLKFSGRSSSPESSRPRFPQERHSQDIENRARGRKHSRKTR